LRSANRLFSSAKKHLSLNRIAGVRPQLRSRLSAGKLLLALVALRLVGKRRIVLALGLIELRLPVLVLNRVRVTRQCVLLLEEVEFHRHLLFGELKFQFPGRLCVPEFCGVVHSRTTTATTAATSAAARG
jgi:hypothetical protein